MPPALSSFDFVLFFDGDVNFDSPAFAARSIDTVRPTVDSAFVTAVRCAPLSDARRAGHLLLIALVAKILSACHHAVLDDPGRPESGERWAQRRAAELRATPRCSDVAVPAEFRGVYLVVNCGAVRYMQCFPLPIGGFQCFWIAPPLSAVVIGEAQSPAESTQNLDELRVFPSAVSSADAGGSDASDRRGSRSRDAARNPPSPSP